MQLLHSTQHGSGNQNLIILHGLFGQSDNWATLGKRFAKDYTVHLLDLRNHGRSFHSDQMDLKLMANDLAYYIDQNNLKEVFVLGHSLGGKVAIELAMLYPEKLSKLMVADIAPKSYPPHHQAIIKGLQSVDFKEVKSRSEADKVLSNYIPTLAIRQFLLKNLYWKTKEELAFRFNLEAIANHYQHLIGAPQANQQFNKPSLFLAGEQSDYILPEDNALISSLFKDCHIETIGQAGHWLHAENPDEFYAKTMRFLQS